MSIQFIPRAFCYILALVFLNSAYGQGFKITSGAAVIVNNDGNIIINNGGISNDGTFMAGAGVVALTGTESSLTASIGGLSPLLFYNLSIDKSAGNARLLSNIAVTNNAAIVSNYLDLNGFNLDLGTTGSVTGQGFNYVMSSSGGFLIRTAAANAPSDFDPGNIGVRLTSASNLGNITIKRGHTQQVTASGYSIKRFFDFLPANNTALDATVKFYYYEPDLAGINEAELQQWSSGDSGTSWTLLGADAQDLAENFVVKNNVNTLQRITLGSVINNPLPLSLLLFTGKLFNNQALLTWAAANQVNTDHFELQRSADAIHFAGIANIAAAGTYSGSRVYTYTDSRPFTGMQYYRLKTVNIDGSLVYSSIIVVNKGPDRNLLLSAYPNPAHELVNIQFMSSATCKVVLHVTAVNGTILLNKEYRAIKGFNQINCNIAGFAQGTYFIKLLGIDNKIARIIKD